jgi:hypothetical protein
MGFRWSSGPSSKVEDRWLVAGSDRGARTTDDGRRARAGPLFRESNLCKVCCLLCESARYEGYSLQLAWAGCHREQLP